MRSPEDAVPVGGLRTGTPPRRSLVVAIVMLASAGTGFAGSRIWPLPTISGPMMHLSVTDNTGTDPESRVTSPSLAPQVSTSAVASDRSASLDDFPQSGAVAVKLPTPQIEAEISSTSTHARNDQRTTAPRHRVASVKASRTAREQRPRTANIVEFAPNPRPDQALRDFMGRSTRN
jgi:hypothetical protein